MLAGLLLDWILGALLLLLVAHFLPGFRVAGEGSAIIAVIAVALVNATAGLVPEFAAFPLSILTFGLFLLGINAIALKVAAALMPGFSIRGLFPAFVAALLLSLLHILLRYAFSARLFHGTAVSI
jgi:putative membrane protein